MTRQFKFALIQFFSIAFFQINVIHAQCTLPPLANAIARQPDLYQLIGNNDGAYDTPNGQQDIIGGNTPEDGNWLNRGNLNLIANGDFSLPGTNQPLTLPNGTGTNSAGAIQLESLPNWTIRGNSSNAYPKYGLTFGIPLAAQSLTDYNASRVNLYLGNGTNTAVTLIPVFDTGYATNGNLVNPHITAQGITAGYGQATGDPISIEQAIPTIIDSIYRLQFFVTGESTGWFGDWVMGLDISGYQRSILRVPGSNNKVRYEFEFKARAISTLIKFINWGHSAPPFNTTEFVLDDVIVNFISSACSVVPVEIKYFEVFHQNGHANLHWETSAEQNCERFGIETATNGVEWKPLGNVKANGTSNTLKKYYYIQDRPNPGRNFYRIKKVDFDGKYSYSDTKSLLIPDRSDISVINDAGKLSVFCSGNLKIRSLIIYSSNAESIFKIQNYNLSNIDIDNYANYPTGMYVLHITDSKGNVHIKKIIKLQN